MAREYALIGNFNMNADQNRGLTLCGYCPETGSLSRLGIAVPEMNIGWQTYNPATDTVYVTDEVWSQPGCTGGGGGIASLKLDHAAGILECTGYQRTFAANPCYLCLDQAGEFLLVVHHTTEHFVTRTVRKNDGTLDAETLYDSCTLVMYELKADGRIGGACDVVEVLGEDRLDGHRWPHLHAVIPWDGFFVVNDKGLRRIYVYAIDRDHKKLVRLSQTDAPEEGEARYGVFDQARGIYYLNYENRAFLNAYTLHPKTGRLDLQDCVHLNSGLGPAPRPSDIAIHPNGHWLYVALRTTNEVAVVALDGNDAMKQVQTVPCGGTGPRGLRVSPEGRWLYTLNGTSGTVFGFSVRDDGKLQPVGEVLNGGSPGNMQFLRDETK